MHKEKFVCDMCGICCQSLNGNALYDDLNDGTGVCIYYDHETHKCKIYEKRPNKCNIEKYYDNIKNQISYEEYLNMNYEICKRLKGGY